MRVLVSVQCERSAARRGRACCCAALCSRRVNWSLPEALVRTIEAAGPNAERAPAWSQRRCSPGIGRYRPQIVASLTAGLQAVRLLPDNTVQTATLHTWTIGRQ